MTHIISNLPEEYQTIVEMIKDGLYKEDNPLTTKRICDKLSEKFDHIKDQTRTIISREYEKSLYINTQYKGTCTTWGKYEHNSKYC